MIIFWSVVNMMKFFDQAGLSILECLSCLVEIHHIVNERVALQVPNDMLHPRVPILGLFFFKQEGTVFSWRDFAIPKVDLIRLWIGDLGI